MLQTCFRSHHHCTCTCGANKALVVYSVVILGIHSILPFFLHPMVFISIQVASHPLLSTYMSMTHPQILNRIVTTLLVVMTRQQSQKGPPYSSYPQQTTGELGQHIYMGL